MKITEGIVNAQIMPCNTDGSIDFGAMAALIDRQRHAGIKGLFVLGTAGLGPLMTIEERLDALERIMAVSEGLFVIVNTGASRLEDVKVLTHHAVQQGVDAVASVPPIYYQPDFAVVRSYYEKMKDLAGAIPVVAYNNPNATGVHLSPAQLTEMTNSGTISGVKQAWASVSEMQVLLRNGVRVWVANANLATAGFAMGAFGAVSTITNVAPELFVSLFERVRVGDFTATRDLQHRIDLISSKLRNPIIGALHAGAEIRSCKAGIVREPLRMPSETELRELSDVIEQVFPKKAA